MVGVTVNGHGEDAVAPDTATDMFPVNAPLGTVADMLDELQAVAVASLLPKETVLVPWLDPKFPPVTVTEDPTEPPNGDMSEMLGAGVMVALPPPPELA